MRRRAALVASLLLLAGCGADDAPESRQPEAGQPPSRLLGGGVPAFEQQLRELRGTPVVVNKWASWCPPCRAELPHFRDQARKRKGRVAFLGVDSNDNDANAREFLREVPLPFPSYTDPKSEIAAEIKAVQAFPATAFYNSKGRLAFVHQGYYRTESELAEDIGRYAR
jgi:cytochrome c biogenesis protein CcmG, thiol:disulfide interchange protein DsbE